MQPEYAGLGEGGTYYFDWAGMCIEPPMLVMQARLIKQPVHFWRFSRLRIWP
jgi:hypothetical protein